MTFSVQTRAYCGMLIPHGEYDTLDEARDRVARRLRYLRRQGCPIVKLGADAWEVCEPDDCVMVPDFCGVLSIRKLVEDLPLDEDDFEYMEEPE